MPSMYYTEMDRAAAERKETMDRRTLELHEHTQGGVPKYSAHVDPKYTGEFMIGAERETFKMGLKAVRSSEFLLGECTFYVGTETSSLPM